MQHLLLLLLLVLLTAFAKDASAGMASSSASKKAKVAVVGGTGRLGRQAVATLLKRNVPVKCLIRKDPPPDFLQGAPPPKEEGLLEFVRGDVTSPEAATELLRGCTACLALHGSTRKSKLSDLWSNAEDSDPSHAKQVNYRSMQYLLDAARASKTCDHIVRITGKGEDPFGIFSILINGLGSMAKGWNYEGEQYLRSNCNAAAASSSKVDYTIIRPGIMKPDYEPPPNVHLELADDGRDLPVSAVSYQQIADLCVSCIFCDGVARGTTLTAMNVENEPGGGEGSSASLEERLARVRKDTRTFPSSLIAEHKKAVAYAFSAFGIVVAAVFAKIAASLISLLR